jgi:NADPH-dependent methylglyoxal reductase
MSGKVLVTGTTGYTGAHVLDLLVRHQYPVIAVVRNIDQGIFYKTRYPSALLAFIEVPDISQENALDFIFKLNPDIRYVIHLATPVPQCTFSSSCCLHGLEPDRTLFEPAIRTSLNIINAVDKYGSNVRTVVFGSCFAAMMNDPPRFNDPRKVYSARDLNRIAREQARTDCYHAYIGAKAFAEDAAWKRYSDIFPSFSLTVIVTPLVLGPPIHNWSISSLNQSAKAVYSLLSDKSCVKPLPMPFYVDVRDAALAYIKAIQLIPPETNRWFVVANNISSQQIIDIVRDKFPTAAKRLPVGVPGSGEDEILQQCAFDVSDTEDIIGIKYRSLEQTVVAFYEKILELEEMHGRHDM